MATNDVAISSSNKTSSANEVLCINLTTKSGNRINSLALKNKKEIERVLKNTKNEEYNNMKN